MGEVGNEKGVLSSKSIDLPKSKRLYQVWKGRNVIFFLILLVAIYSLELNLRSSFVFSTISFVFLFLFLIAILELNLLLLLLFYVSPPVNLFITNGGLPEQGI